MSQTTESNTTEVSSIDDALKKLSSMSVVPTGKIEAPIAPSDAEAIFDHVEAIIGRAAFNFIGRSRQVRALLESYEKRIEEDLKTTRERVFAHLEKGENLFTIASFLEAEMKKQFSDDVGRKGAS